LVIFEGCQIPPNHDRFLQQLASSHRVFQQQMGRSSECVPFLRELTDKRVVGKMLHVQVSGIEEAINPLEKAASRPRPGPRNILSPARNQGQVRDHSAPGAVRRDDGAPGKRLRPCPQKLGCQRAPEVYNPILLRGDYLHMVHDHDPALMALSILIASQGSLVSLSLAREVGNFEARRRLAAIRGISCSTSRKYRWLRVPDLNLRSRNPWLVTPCAAPSRLRSDHCECCALGAAGGDGAVGRGCGSWDYS
jgi:hypothetical protein